jgi:putative membrane protein
MKIKRMFSEQDLKRISNAVREAEQKISGEVVPVIVERSGSYTIASYKAAIVSAALAFVFMIILDRYIITDDVHTIYYDPFFIFIVVAAAGLIGGLLTHYIDPLKRIFISRQYLDMMTRQVAETAFLEEEVFATRQRTGIMIFISFFEHEVVVMADKGINEVVDQKEWDSLVALLIAGIKEGNVVGGLERAIKRCGEILLEKGFVKTDDDVNELGDDLRING